MVENLTEMAHIMVILGFDDLQCDSHWGSYWVSWMYVIKADMLYSVEATNLSVQNVISIKKAKLNTAMSLNLPGEWNKIIHLLLLYIVTHNVNLKS